MSGAVASTVGSGSSTFSASCYGKSGSALLTVDAAALRSIVVTPTTASVARGLTTQLTATGRYSDATTQDLTHAVTWQSDDPAIATVDEWGLVTGVQEGAAAVTATIGSLTSQSDITVGAPVVTGLQIAPGGPKAPAGESQQFTATASWSAGPSSDVTDQAIWTSATPSVATIDASGLATAVAAGSSTISASYGGSSDSTTFTVAAPALQSLTVSPHTVSIAKGDTQTFTVMGHYSDSTSAPVTTGLTWTTGTPAVASVTTGGVASGLAVGSSTVTATADGLSDSATLTVTPAELRGISLTPADPAVAKGQDVDMTATGTFSDGTQGNVTGSVNWSSADGTVATVGSDGVVHGVSEGQTAITAAANGHSAQVSVTVGAPVVTSLAVQAMPASVPLGETSQLTAIATMSDGTHPEVTNTATWTSSDENVASVNGSGVVDSQGVGVAEITGSYRGVVESTNVTVTDAVLRSITVTSQSTHVARGLTTRLTAAGTMSDNTPVDLTTTAAWSSADDSTATVDGSGVLTAVGEGTTTITAAVGDVSSHIDVTVDPAIVTTVTVSTDRAMVASGETQQFTASATRSDGSSSDVSDLATWSSTNPSVATVDSNGLVTSLGTGEDYISASYGGVTSDPTWFYVGPATVSSVTLTTTATQLANGEHATLTLTAHYTDGSSAVVPSDQVVWSSSDPSVAGVSAGDVWSTGEGTTTISALAMGQRDSFDLTVGPAVLSSLAIAPASISLAKGNGTTLTALDMYTDAHSEPVTGTVTWSTGDASIATVDGNGTLTGVAIGHTTVTATADGLTATNDVDVTAPEMVGLSATASPQSVPLGVHSQTHARAAYSDGSTADLTGAVTWTSENPAVATVSAAGVVTTLEQGNVTIDAAYGDAGQVQWLTSTVVSVTAPVLRSLAITPTSYTVRPGRTKAYVATGTFSDGTRRNVSSLVHWSTGSTKVAKVGVTGVVTGVAYGTTAVRAVSGVISATAASVHVTHKPPTVTGLSPAKGRVGTLITITGSNFVKRPVMTVKFGSTKAGTITYVSSTKIRVRVPRGARTGYLYVVNDGGTGRSKGYFHVLR
jgi:uncharacterized protein YjdB